MLNISLGTGTGNNQDHVYDRCLHVNAWHGRHIWWNVRHLTHWGRKTHIFVIKVTIIGSDNGLSPDRRQAIIWTNAGEWLIGPLGTNFDEILIEIHTFSFKKIHFKMASGKWRPLCLSLNVLTHWGLITLHPIYTSNSSFQTNYVQKNLQDKQPIGS